MQLGGYNSEGNDTSRMQFSDEDSIQDIIHEYKIYIGVYIIIIVYRTEEFTLDGV